MHDTSARMAAPDAASYHHGAVATATPPSWDGRRLRAAALASVAKAVPERVVGNDVIAEGAGVIEWAP